MVGGAPATELHKRWIGQVTSNMADDEELLALAAKAKTAM